MPTKEVLTEGLRRLASEYEKTVQAPRAAAWERELSGWSDEDWRAAVQMILDDPDRSTFPRIGQMKAALSRASDARRRRNVGQTRPDPDAVSGCACDDGLVQIKKKLENGSFISSIGACIICDAGKLKPRIMKRVRPLEAAMAPAAQ